MRYVKLDDLRYGAYVFKICEMLLCYVAAAVFSLKIFKIQIDNMSTSYSLLPYYRQQQKNEKRRIKHLSREGNR